MSTKQSNVIYNGEVLEGYVITKNGKITSPAGTILKVSTKGNVIIQYKGKRKSVNLESIIKESFPATNKPTPKKLKKQEEPTIYYDLDTRNLSFIRVAHELHQLGVKNNKFFLALFNKELIGVDPFDHRLSRAKKQAITVECMKNPFYFFRECVRIPLQNGGVVPFELNRSNLVAIFTSFNNVSSYLVTPRALFRTMSASAIALYFYKFATRNDIGLYDKHRDDAVNILNRIKTLETRLPSFLRSNFTNPQDVKQTMVMTDGARQNTIVVKPSPVNVAQASNIGRGMTHNIKVINDFEFIRHGDFMLREAGHVSKLTKEIALRRGGNSFTLIVTAVGDQDEVESNFMDTIDGCVVWREEFYDLLPGELSALVDASDSGMVYAEHSHDQLGKGDDYINENKKLLLYDKRLIDRELYLIRPNVSSKAEQSMPLNGSHVVDNHNSIHPWYLGTVQHNKALDMYSTINFNLFADIVPATVLNDMALDGIPKEAINPAMVKAYTVRHITSVLLNGLNINPSNVYENEAETIFAIFGVTERKIVQSMLLTDGATRSMYIDTLMEFLKYSTPSVGAQISSYGKFTLTSLHIMLLHISAHKQAGATSV